MLKVSGIFKFIFFYSCSLSFTLGQSLPPVNHFQMEDYAADNQNWSITQTQDHTLFFANGKGLLKFNGEHWELLGSPNNTILRSVYAVEDVVYTGAYMEFGVWKKNSTGSYVYTSLSEDIELIEDEQFWTIGSLEDYIIFQSLDAIYMYNQEDNSMMSFEGNGEITKMVILDNELYFHEKKSGLFKLLNGRKILLNDSKVLKESTLINIYKLNDQLYAQTQFNGIINVSDNQIYSPSNSTSTWSDLSVYSSFQNANGDIYLGTISNGLYKISQDSIVYNLNQQNTLSNNTVLSVFRDKSNNIWLGLDNGINSIDDDSYISIFNDKDGKIGTIYASIFHKGRLYIGSNQGLFYYDASNAVFSIVEGTNGQVWSLFSHKDTLFCGHHNGTYLIEEDRSKLIENIRGTWTFRIKDENTI
jgi:ligand-binding sensor domain-containing protein